MSSYPPSSPYAQKKSFFSQLWSVIDALRKVVFNLIFLAIIAFFFYAVFFSGGGVKVQDKSALVLNLDGRIVEQASGSPRERLLAQVSGESDGQTQLRDVIAVLQTAAEDKKIDRVFLQLDQFQGGGLTAMREVAAAMEKFKASGKQIVAWGGMFDQNAYYLAAHANEVYLHPMGGVMLQGYGRYRNYYKDAFDRIGVNANVIRSGKYKNFGEPYFTNGPSKETLESDKYLYDGLWATYTTDVEKARKLEAGTINKTIEDSIALMKAAGGDSAKMALNAKLVTALKTRDEMRAIMIERGAKDEKSKSFRQVSMGAYMSKVKPQLIGDAVGVIVAEGGIEDGNAPPGRIGGRSTADLVRKAREDESVKAVVLRVNSPGGSAYGSELIRRELELTKAAGKPVVISMGSVAASGGYWISMASDEVIADAATITGSIGVFGMLPTGEKAMEKLSVSTGGYSTTWLGAAMYDPRRPLDPRMAEIVKLSIDRIYSDFTGGAAKARKTTPDKIDEVAQGRVWTGAQAKERGLIDKVGSFADAIKSAQTRAKLDEKSRVAYIETERSKLDQFLESFGSTTMQTLAKHFDVKFASPLNSIANLGVAKDMQRDVAWLAEAAQQSKTNPTTVYAHCLCTPE
jgi:protease IV